jgi:acyl dehydratase
MSLKTYTFEKVTREQIRDYAEASGDWNKIHIEDDFAKEAGLPGIIGHGMLSMGLAARALAEWGYDFDRLTKFSSKFKDKVVPGDELTAVLEKVQSEDSAIGKGKTFFHLKLLNQNSAEILTATFEFDA